MLKSIRIHLRILVIHGVLAFWLGLALFYLRATMTNWFFEGIAVVFAILLAATSLILGGIADWMAAWWEGSKHLNRLTFYLFAGLVSALAGAFLGIYLPFSMQWLLLLAALHALFFGLLSFSLAWKAKHHGGFERRAMYLFGAASVIFSGTMASLATRLDNRGAAAILGVYFCFVSMRLLFLAWQFHCMARIADGFSLDARTA